MRAAAWFVVRAAGDGGVAVCVGGRTLFRRVRLVGYVPLPPPGMLAAGGFGRASRNPTTTPRGGDNLPGEGGGWGDVTW